jgi:hypothetical protein
MSPRTTTRLLAAMAISMGWATTLVVLQCSAPPKAPTALAELPDALASLLNTASGGALDGRGPVQGAEDALSEGSASVDGAPADGASKADAATTDHESPGPDATVPSKARRAPARRPARDGKGSPDSGSTQPAAP